MNRRPDALACEQPHRRSAGSQNFPTGIDRQRQAWARIYRANVEAESRHFPEVTIYVEADSPAEAMKRIQHAAEAIGYAPLTPDDDWKISGLRTANDLLDTGMGGLLTQRLFEKGVNGDHQLQFIRAPIFAVRDPAELLELWNQLAYQLRHRRFK